MTNEKKITELEKKARKLKNNRENIPEDKLETVYKTAYHRLKAETEALGCRVMLEIIFDGTDPGYLPDHALDSINRALSAGGYTRSASEALYRADMEAFLGTAQKAAEAVRKIVNSCREETCGIYITPESLEDGGPEPYFYSPLTEECLTGYSWQGDQITGGRWIPAPACG